MNKWVYRGLMTVCLTMAAVSGYYIYDTLKEQARSKSVYDEIKNETEKIIDTKDDVPAWKKVRIDFDKLHEVNTDVVGWLKFDSIDIIDYPILYSGDNDKYLRHDMYGTWLNAGSIFIEGSNKPDFTDSHTILYGHSMKNKTMFGRLKDYYEPEFCKNNQFLTIYTPSKAMHYQIFSVYDVNPDDGIYTTQFVDLEQFFGLASKMKENSIYPFDVEIIPESKVLTMSTCSGDYNEYRLTVNAVLVEEYYYSE